MPSLALKRKREKSVRSLLASDAAVERLHLLAANIATSAQQHGSVDREVYAFIASVYKQILVRILFHLDVMAILLREAGCYYGCPSWLRSKCRRGTILIGHHTDFRSAMSSLTRSISNFSKAVHTIAQHLSEERPFRGRLRAVKIFKGYLWT